MKFTIEQKKEIYGTLSRIRVKYEARKKAEEKELPMKHTREVEEIILEALGKRITEYQDFNRINALSETISSYIESETESLRELLHEQCEQLIKNEEKIKAIKTLLKKEKKDD